MIKISNPYNLTISLAAYPGRERTSLASELSSTPQVVQLK